MKIRFVRSMMGCVPNYYCKCKPKEFCNIDHSGDYYPAADYEALEAKLAALVEAATTVREYLMGSSWRYVQSPDEFIKAAIAAAKVTP